jgi:hypothetical protein
MEFGQGMTYTAPLGSGSTIKAPASFTAEDTRV